MNQLKRIWNSLIGSPIAANLWLLAFTFLLFSHSEIRWKTPLIVAIMQSDLEQSLAVS
jgi:hypothetical protein